MENHQQKQMLNEVYRLNRALETQREVSGRIEGLLKYAIQLVTSSRNINVNPPNTQSDPSAQVDMDTSTRQH